MSNRTRVWLVAVTVALLVKGVSGTGAGNQAQAGAGRVIARTAIQRSLAVQSELKRIEANREAFVDELLSRWAPYVEPEVDLWGHVKSVAMGATPWRLLGASLASDFESGYRVLRGVVGPGWDMSAFIEGREPVIGAGTAQAQASVPDPAAEALGDPTASLVFTPIAPCRIADTRRVFQLIGAGSTWSYDFTASGLTKGYGGDTSCPGLPTAQASAWAVNITATGYTSAGHVTVWPYLTTKPSTSFMNYFPSAYAVANAGTVTGNSSAGTSVRISPSSDTHIVIDIMGYYSEATGFAGGAVTTLAGTPVGLPAGGAVEAFGASCPTGTVLVSGGATSDGGTTLISESFKVGDHWALWVRNDSSTNADTVFPYSVLHGREVGALELRARHGQSSCRPQPSRDAQHRRHDQRRPGIDPMSRIPSERRER